MLGFRTGTEEVMETELLYGCSIQGCDEIATVTVDGLIEGEQSLCGPHWQQTNAMAPMPLRTGRVLERPTCPLPDCGQAASVIRTETGGQRTPVCERHSNELGGELLVNARARDTA
jgi:hypothetical protein